MNSPLALFIDISYTIAVQLNIWKGELPMTSTIGIKPYSLILTFIIALMITTPAGAQGPITGDTIPVGTQIDHDVILVGQNVTIEGIVNGNAFILGNQVTVNGTVDGSIILISQNAGIGGSVSGAVYAAAMTLALDPNSTIQRDLYVVTISLTSGDQSVIGRDLYAIGLDSGLNGSVGRNLHTVIGPIQLYNGLMTLLGYENLTIKLHFETPQPATGSSGSVITARHLARLRSMEAATTSFDWGKWALNLLRNWLVLLAISLVLFWLARNPLFRSAQVLHSHPWRSIGIGSIALVISFALIGVALLLIVIIFAVGLGLNYLGLWQISLALWAAAYSCLAFLLVTLWFFISYATKIIAIFTVSNWVFLKTFNREGTWLKLIVLLAGTLAFSLLRAIPYVGWIINLLATVAGLGAAWITWRDSTRKPVPIPSAIPEKRAPKLPNKK
jgi:hypothetical protein